MSKIDVVICHPVRTAIGTYAGTLKDLPAPSLGAAAIRECLKRSGLSGERVQSVVMGNVIQAGVRMNPSRQAAIAGGLPVEVPAMTVNRVCGSGAQAIASAALEIWSGQIDCALAGGMENMDRAPYLLPQGRWGARMGDVSLIDSMLHDGLNDAFSGKHSGWHAEDLVIRNGISRTAGRCVRSSASPLRRRPAGLPPRSRPSRCRGARDSRCSTRTSTTGRKPRPSRWPGSNLRFAPKARSPRATRRVSIQALR